MKRFITGVCMMVAAGAQGQSILGKHPADKVLPGFFDQNGNADTTLDGINRATLSLDAARIPGLDASKIVSGTIDMDRLPSGLDHPFDQSVNSSDSPTFGGLHFFGPNPILIQYSVQGGGTHVNTLSLAYDNLIFDANMQAHRFFGSGLGLTELDAGAMDRGTLDPARIPGLDGSRIVSGTIDPARLPVTAGSGISINRDESAGTLTISSSLPQPLSAADSPTFGGLHLFGPNPILIQYSVQGGGTHVNTLSLAYDNFIFDANMQAHRFFGSGLGLTQLDAGAMDRGTLDPARIPALDASKIASGTLNPAQVPLDTPIASGAPEDVDWQADFSKQVVTWPVSDNVNFIGSSSLPAAGYWRAVTYCFIGGDFDTQFSVSDAATSWHWLTAKTMTLKAGKRTYLTLDALGPNESDVTAALVQEQ